MPISPTIVNSDAITVTQPQETFKHGRIHGLKSGRRIMASARNEAPEGAEGDGVWGRVPPHHRGGICPSPEFFLIFELKIASFVALWELILLQLKTIYPILCTFILSYLILSYLILRQVSMALLVLVATFPGICVKQWGGFLHDYSRPKIWGESGRHAPFVSPVDMPLLQTLHVREINIKACAHRRWLT